LNVYCEGMLPVTETPSVYADVYF